jgi:beta-carotene 3-hydroxylase
VPDLVFYILLMLATVLAMEVTANLVHKYIMHGPLGWGWHKSHHEPHDEVFERNDLYAVLFAVPSVLLIYFGLRGAGWMAWVGAGFFLYGLIYFILHDVLVHRRWSLKLTPRGSYLKRLYQAHRMHHAVQGRAGCVSFGFLYAPPVDKLKSELKSLHGGSVRLGGLDPAE